MRKIKKIIILGCSGSIGQQTIDVVRKHRDKLKIEGLVAFSSKKKLEAAVNEFNVKKQVLIKTEKSEEEANKRIIELIRTSDADIIVNAISGFCGLQFSYETLKAEKTLALANKESLVVGGDILMPMAKKLKEKFGEEKLLPIDSEHGAIFQCLIGESESEVYRLWITASGGPFYGLKLNDLKTVTKKQALSHPTWNMGPKITIDSATLMNKGLEVIEAHHLFGVDDDKIDVVVQKQSAIHSMVEFADGSVKAHLGTTDMRIPIQYALSFPERWDAPVERLDFKEIGSLNFGKPDLKTFKCLQLAFDAMKIGGTMPCVMNAANEIAVSKFLNEEISFTYIFDVVEKTMDAAKNKGIEKVNSLQQLNDWDMWSREIALKI